MFFKKWNLASNKNIDPSINPYVVFFLAVSISLRSINSIVDKS